MFFQSLPYSRFRRPFLVLHRNEDAERDCTTVLGLSAFNAKALFRRGQARVGMSRLDEGRQGGSAPSVLRTALRFFVVRLRGGFEAGTSQCVCERRAGQGGRAAGKTKLQGRPTLISSSLC